MIAMDEVDERSAKLTPVQRAIRIRCQQAAINDLYNGGLFRIPIHLAFGHEPVAVGLALAMTDGDQVVLSHRNLHYQLAVGASVSEVVREFLLQDDGLAGGRYGSMNLINPAKGIAYTSSILGNNLSVAVGVALAQAIRNERACTWVVTGDGALEEGAFAESLLLLKTLSIPLITIIEDNGWSLATSVEERRSHISIDLLAGAYGVRYLKANDKGIEACIEVMQAARNFAGLERTPVVVHVPLDTLGGRWVDDSGSSTGRRFINYHAGPAKEVTLSNFKEALFASEDPLAEVLTEPWVEAFIEEVRSELGMELAWTTSLK